MKMRDISSRCDVQDESKCCALQHKAGRVVTLTSNMQVNSENWTLN